MQHLLALDPAAGVGLFMPGLWVAAAGGDREVSVLDVAARHRALMAATGLGGAAVAAPLWASCAVPLVSPDRARVAAVEDQLLGHPLFWMPDRLLSRYELVDAEGSVEVEGPDVWVARVLLEAIASGWYERSTGRWIDVVEDQGLERQYVRSWLAGQVQDPRLEALEAPVGPEDQWAIEAAQGLVVHLRAASDALAAAEISAALRVGDAQAVRAGAAAAGVIGVVDGHSPPSGVWEQLVVDPGDQGLIDEALAYLEGLRDDGEASLRELAEVFLGPGGIDS